MSGRLDAPIGERPPPIRAAMGVGSAVAMTASAVVDGLVWKPVVRVASCTESCAEPRVVVAPRRGSSRKDPSRTEKAGSAWI